MMERKNQVSWKPLYRGPVRHPSVLCGPCARRGGGDVVGRILYELELRTTTDRVLRTGGEKGKQETGAGIMN